MKDLTYKWRFVLFKQFRCFDLGLDFKIVGQ